MEATKGQVMQFWTCVLSGFNEAPSCLMPAKASHSQGRRTVHGEVCVCSCWCVSGAWTNISSWAINHCSNRSFNLVEAWVQGCLTAIDMLRLTAELYLEVLSTKLIQHVAPWSSLVFWHTVRESVEWKKRNKTQEEDTETERSATLSPNQQGPSRFPTPSYAMFPRQRAYG